eukprot:CAMPEP_0172525602 /NCGR_PEP_ID=MMETSP1067-20121228/657_1 /TAXON_ID=265564 ORGANISM="Thalassiosira punctigera, Strain Tpunct2005C2" /NCGR_SAMPLE_ID=MMETSP1067 /ASSEMBLY_ACC=CAM_ASM_000444 /LENGTH=135 /DNA_ID=CAMNT_0013308911 /DNA_START=77 /DNA_END=484 /DNA_ORIENTATION=-
MTDPHACARECVGWSAFLAFLASAGHESSLESSAGQDSWKAVRGSEVALAPGWLALQRHEEYFWKYVGRSAWARPTEEMWGLATAQAGLELALCSSESPEGILGAKRGAELASAGEKTEMMGNVAAAAHRGRINF